MNGKQNERMRELLKNLNETGDFNGNVLIGEGDLIFQESLGVADFRTGRLLNPDTVFDLASLSKAFTAMAVMILKERGQLSYEDRVETCFPQFPYTGITVRQLLTHTSGLPDYIELFLREWNREKVACNEDVVEMLQRFKPPAQFLPGEKFAYSNTGYVMLALLIEKVSGIPFARFLKENIFLPLEMKDTEVINRGLGHKIPENFAFGYIRQQNPDRYVPAEDLPETDFVRYMDGMQGDGAVNSTVKDLYKWDRALYTDRLVSSETLAEAFKPVKLTDGTSFGYGFGWGLLHDERGSIARHSGGWPGYKTILIRYLDRNQVMIVLCNVEQSDTVWLRTIESLEKIMFEEDCAENEMRI